MNGTTPTDANIAPPVPDWVLVARVLDGERGAFEWIMRRYNQRIYRLVRSILHHEQDVLDTMQDAYVKGFRRLDQFKGPDGLGAWLCSIARNEALARLRKTQPVAAQEYIDMAEQPDHYQVFLQPLDQASQQQLRALLEQAVDQLPLIYREVFMMRAVQQLDTRDTARMLGIDEQLVKTRYLRGKRLLRTLLDVHIEGAGLHLHEFAGRRCDAMVSRVLNRLAKDEPGPPGS
ncbi:RNA polymerase sigma factor [Marinobacterium rhizophilum]|uniref:RNA polymerase sigma factor n=1 Tax=Marinobacterium rhizophilum TaxID=420402 RepID=UPI00035C536C|nr:RNA polymerase sigma factor [Marinobacterium rhizophilum]